MQQNAWNWNDLLWGSYFHMSQLQFVLKDRTFEFMLFNLLIY